MWPQALLVPMSTFFHVNLEWPFATTDPDLGPCVLPLSSKIFAFMIHEEYPKVLLWLGLFSGASVTASLPHWFQKENERQTQKTTLSQKYVTEPRRHQKNAFNSAQSTNTQVMQRLVDNNKLLIYLATLLRRTIYEIIIAKW